MTPCLGNTILFRSSQQLPRLCLGPSKGFFELTRRPSRALNLPRALLPELQRKKDTVRGVVLGVEVPGRRQKQPTQTFVETNFLHQPLIVKSQQNRIEIVTRPGCNDVFGSKLRAINMQMSYGSFSSHGSPGAF